MQKLQLKKPKPTYSYDLFTDGITQSALANFLTCPEKFRLSMISGYSTDKDSYAIEFGNIVHEALDKIYSQFSKFRTLDDALYVTQMAMAALHENAVKKARVFKILNSDIEETLNKNYSLAGIVLELYFKKWFNEDKKRDWVALEQQFDNLYTFRNSNPKASFTIPLKGKIDGVYRKGKKLWQFETKTKGQIDEQQMKSKLHFDLQNFFYLYNSNLMYNEAPSGVLYNVIRRPMLRQGAKETFPSFCDRVRSDIEDREDFYFLRWDISISQQEFEVWKAEFEKMVRLLVRTHMEGEYFRNSTACVGMGICQFLNLCSVGNMEGLRVRDNIFPELG